jgi:hypothetical protein
MCSEEIDKEKLKFVNIRMSLNQFFYKFEETIWAVA